MAFAYNKSTITHAGQSGGGSGQLTFGPRAKQRLQQHKAPSDMWGDPHPPGWPFNDTKGTSRNKSGPRRDHGGLTATGGGVTPPSGGGVTHAGMRTPGTRGASTRPHTGPGSPPHGGRPKYKSRVGHSFGPSTRGYSK